MGLFDILKPKVRVEPPLAVPPRGKAWHPELDVEPDTGHVVIWPAADASGMSACFDPKSPTYHSTVVFALGDVPRDQPSPPSEEFLKQFLASEIRCIAGAFGADVTAEFDADKAAGKNGGFRQIDTEIVHGARNTYYEFTLKTKGWIGPANHEKAVLKALEKHAGHFASKAFLVPKAYTLRPHHDLHLDGLLRVSQPESASGSAPGVAGDRRTLFAFGFGSRFTDGYLEANNWPNVKPEVSGFLYGTRWRLK